MAAHASPSSHTAPPDAPPLFHGDMDPASAALILALHRADMEEAQREEAAARQQQEAEQQAQQAEQVQQAKRALQSQRAERANDLLSIAESPVATAPPDRPDTIDVPMDAIHSGPDEPETPTRHQPSQAQTQSPPQSPEEVRRRALHKIKSRTKTRSRTKDELRKKERRDRGSGGDGAQSHARGDGHRRNGSEYYRNSEAVDDPEPQRRNGSEEDRSPVNGTPMDGTAEHAIKGAPNSDANPNPNAATDFSPPRKSRDSNKSYLSSERARRARRSAPPHLEDMPHLDRTEHPNKLLANVAAGGAPPSGNGPATADPTTAPPTAGQAGPSSRHPVRNPLVKAHSDSVTSLGTFGRGLQLTASSLDDSHLSPEDDLSPGARWERDRERERERRAEQRRKYQDPEYRRERRRQKERNKARSGGGEKNAASSMRVKSWLSTSAGAIAAEGAASGTESREFLAALCDKSLPSLPMTASDEEAPRNVSGDPGLRVNTSRGGRVVTGPLTAPATSQSFPQSNGHGTTANGPTANGPTTNGPVENGASPKGMGARRKPVPQRLLGRAAALTDAFLPSQSNSSDPKSPRSPRMSLPNNCVGRSGTNALATPPQSTTQVILDPEVVPELAYEDDKDASPTTAAAAASSAPAPAEDHKERRKQRRQVSIDENAPEPNGSVKFDSTRRPTRSDLLALQARLEGRVQAEVARLRSEVEKRKAREKEEREARLRTQAAQRAEKAAKRSSPLAPPGTNKSATSPLGKVANAFRFGARREEEERLRARVDELEKDVVEIRSLLARMDTEARLERIERFESESRTRDRSRTASLQSWLEAGLDPLETIERIESRLSRVDPDPVETIESERLAYTRRDLTDSRASNRPSTHEGRLETRVDSPRGGYDLRAIQRLEGRGYAGHGHASPSLAHAMSRLEGKDQRDTRDAYAFSRRERDLDLDSPRLASTEGPPESNYESAVSRMGDGSGTPGVDSPHADREYMRDYVASTRHGRAADGSTSPSVLHVAVPQQRGGSPRIEIEAPPLSGVPSSSGVHSGHSVPVHRGSTSGHSGQLQQGSASGHSGNVPQGSASGYSGNVPQGSTSGYSAGYSAPLRQGSASSPDEAHPSAAGSSVKSKEQSPTAMFPSTETVTPARLQDKPSSPPPQTSPPQPSTPKHPPSSPQRQPSTPQHPPATPRSVESPRVRRRDGSFGPRAMPQRSTSRSPQPHIEARLEKAEPKEMLESSEHLETVLGDMDRAIVTSPGASPTETSSAGINDPHVKPDSENGARGNSAEIEAAVRSESDAVVEPSPTGAVLNHTPVVESQHALVAAADSHAREQAPERARSVPDTDEGKLQPRMLDRLSDPLSPTFASTFSAQSPSFAAALSPALTPSGVSALTPSGSPPRSPAFPAYPPAFGPGRVSTGRLGGSASAPRLDMARLANYDAIRESKSSGSIVSPTSPRIELPALDTTLGIGSMGLDFSTYTDSESDDEPRRKGRTTPTPTNKRGTRNNSRPRLAPSRTASKAHLKQDPTDALSPVGDLPPLGGVWAGPPIPLEIRERDLPRLPDELSSRASHDSHDWVPSHNPGPSFSSDSSAGFDIATDEAVGTGTHDTDVQLQAYDYNYDLITHPSPATPRPHPDQAKPSDPVDLVAVANAAHLAAPQPAYARPHPDRTSTSADDVTIGTVAHAVHVQGVAERVSMVASDGTVDAPTPRPGSHRASDASATASQGSISIPHRTTPSPAPAASRTSPPRASPPAELDYTEEVATDVGHGSVADTLDERVAFDEEAARIQETLENLAGHRRGDPSCACRICERKDEACM